MTLRTLSLLALLTATPAAAQNIGDGFRCPGPEDLPDVLITVGRTDMLSELLGEPVEPDRTILHVQMIGDGADLPLVPHAPFDEAAVAGCISEHETPFDRVAFGEGLDEYRRAVRLDEAGLFNIPPAEAYWLTLGSLPDGDGS
ncbi:hypothetical protein JSE7799_01604 [Jannaschia seosinensis]|uniref:Uncharacterized protein n=1 Tax=Jannaschia seosinensis TaxID=313367 RepID=A0A0M7BC89_9RHOB|nr:hypothetical protein [Jannaschia seosinensis]CUH38886.1 hypothetical protein JSE7799_01604 [Jannaschia seosinensis]